jgi:hypothetical protein
MSYTFDENDPTEIKDSFAWFDEHLRKLDAQYLNPPPLTGLELEEYLEDKAAENFVMPNNVIYKDGKLFRIVTEEDAKIIRKFADDYALQPGISIISTIHEDSQCAIIRYRNARKAELVIVRCLAIAGTDKNEWWILNWDFEIQHFYPDQCLPLTLDLWNRPEKNRLWRS